MVNHKDYSSSLHFFMKMVMVFPVINAVEVVEVKDSVKEIHEVKKAYKRHSKITISDHE